MWVKREYVRTVGNTLLVMFAIGLAFILEFARVKFDTGLIGEGSFWFNVSFTTLLQLLVLFALTYESTERSRDKEVYRSALKTYRQETDILRKHGLIRDFNKYCDTVTNRNKEESRDEMLNIYGISKEDVQKYKNRDRKNLSRKEKKIIKRYIKNKIPYEKIYSSMVLDDINGHKKFNIEHSIKESIATRVSSKIISGIVLSVMVGLLVTELSDGFDWAKAFMFGTRLFIILYNGIAGWQLGQIVMLDERVKVFGSRVNFIRMFAEETDNIKYFNMKEDV